MTEHRNPTTTAAPTTSAHSATMADRARTIHSPASGMRSRGSRLTAMAVLLAAVLFLPACGLLGNDNAGRQFDGVERPGSALAEGQSGDGSVSGATFGNLPVDLFVDSDTRAVVQSTAASDGDIAVYDRPDGTSITTVSRSTDFGTTRVLLVEAEEGDWVKVRLPTRPNHRAGWIPASEVRLEPVDLEVIVDLEARELSVRSGIDVVFQSPIAIGTEENPTPTGTFYITDKLETPNPDGGYGPFAFGLSGYSETLTEFAGGNGQIGIHGTNRPESIGEAVSHGCIRLPNDLISSLAETLPLGTPVHIV